MAWGIAVFSFDDAGCVIIHNSVRLSEPMWCEMADEWTYTEYQLQFFLGGDMEFLHTMCGLQNCSASYPCYYCLVKLSQLQCKLSQLQFKLQEKQECEPNSRHS